MKNSLSNHNASRCLVQENWTVTLFFFKTRPVLYTVKEPGGGCRLGHPDHFLEGGILTKTTEGMMSIVLALTALTLVAGLKRSCEAAMDTCNLQKSATVCGCQTNAPLSFFRRKRERDEISGLPTTNPALERYFSSVENLVVHKVCSLLRIIVL